MADDKVTISTYQFLKRFPTPESARAYLESLRWPEGAICPACGCVERIQTRKLAGYFRCLNCKTDFTVRTGTIMERSHVPLDKWLFAMYLVLTARKGISSVQLSKEIGVTQKTAWFMLQRIREACGIMVEICKAKFTQNPELLMALKATNMELLEEGNNWGDRVWGICPPGSGNGLNWLGLTLMSLRSTL